MRDYSAVLAESVLRHRAWFAEHCARIETELASKVKSEFIANMSHELRTPLNTIIGFAKLLGEQQKRRHQDGQIVEYADLIRDAATHLLAVINDILDISKLQSGKYTVDSKEVDLDEVLQLSLAALKPAAIARGILMESKLKAALPSVRGDAGKLRQVFSNLISNSIKFTPAGGSVTVAAQGLEDGGVSVRICDTGVGMTKEEVALALTPFAQVDAGLSRWQEGAGLGLPIARALVQLHGGTLEINSAKSMGTEVLITLPSRLRVTATNTAAGLGPVAAAPQSG
ncbi:MAG TPA: HAMP domain-containing sensor histidine kinase [Hyphomicrobiaceae bacterium]|jgi:two-component system, cell cycle sensor histidine kinase PleC|nr:HAMP domain-containing sensor histidine kinase [Hyphomicrobiaceae bacterium]